MYVRFFFFNDTATTEIYTLSLHDALPIYPSSPHAMARLVELRDRFDLAFGNDADADRHGIVTPSLGLLNPNHVLAADVAYLFGGARSWRPEVAVGKTLVSTALIDRVVADLGRPLRSEERRVGKEC